MRDYKETECQSRNKWFALLFYHRFIIETKRGWMRCNDMIWWVMADGIGCVERERMDSDANDGVDK